MRYRVSKVRSEHAHIKAASVTHADDGLGIQLIRDSQTRSKRVPGVIDVSIQPNSSFAGNPVQALSQIGESTVVFAIHVLREINFPAQTIIQSQLRGNTPGVLSVIKHAMLTFRRVKTSADVAAHLGHVAEKKSSQVQPAQSAGRTAGCSPIIESVVAGTARIARHS